MADTTNQSGAAAGITLAGDMTRQYAMKRLQRLAQPPPEKPGRVMGPPPAAPVKRY